MDVDPAVIREAVQNPDQPHVEEILAFAGKVERKYAAQVAAFVQTPTDIVEQAWAVREEPASEDTFSLTS